MKSNKAKKSWIAIRIAVLTAWFGVNKIIEVTSAYSAYQKTLADVKSLAGSNNALINSVSSFVLQDKALMAFITNLGSNMT